MPTRPASACPVCRRLHCADPSHKPKPFKDSAPTKVRRPGWDRDRPRREATVKAWKAQHGDWCPGCGAVDYHADGERVVLSADHLEPGNEFGPLGVLCVRCQRSQGSRIANAKRWHKPRP